MPAPLRCPTCSAPLDVPPELATTTRCTYCGAGVLLTERGGHLQAAAAQQRYSDAIHDVLRHLRAGDRLGAIRVYRDHFGVGLAEAKYAVERLEAGQPGGFVAPQVPAARPAAAPARQPRAALAAVLFVVAFSASVGVVAVRGTMDTTAAAPASALRAEGTSFAREVLRFGGQGTGAGRFEDARDLTVDGAGRLYVADYPAGRVQVFDSAGAFLTQWALTRENPVQDMAADRGGTVFLAQNGYIKFVEGSTGRLLRALRGPSVSGWEDVTVALDGTLWAISVGDIVHLDRDGKVLQTIDVPRVVHERAFPEKMVVAGDGHVYAMDHSSGEIYHLDPTGRFVDRFAPEPRPGRPSFTAWDMALDARGRLYVSYLGSGIRVFDPAAGREIGAIDGDGRVFGIAVTAGGDELWAMYTDDGQVVKYRLPR